MSIRQQLPVHSPVSPSALLAGLGALVSGGVAASSQLIDRLRGRFEATDCLLTDSGTTALALALRGSVAESSGSRIVALPAYGCYDLATAADTAGVEVVLYDLNPASLGPDWDSLRAALGRGARAVVVVHPYGLAVDMAEVTRLAAETGAIVVEDAAQGQGGAIAGKPLGSFGSLVVLSFGRGKGLTGGGGGALLAHDDRGRLILQAAPDTLSMAERGVRSLTLTVAQWTLARPALYALPSSLPFLRLGETVYRAPSPARCMPAVSAAVVNTTFDLADREAEIRQANSQRILTSTKASRGLTPFEQLPGSRPGFLRLPFLADQRFRRAASRPTAKALGIMGGYPLPLSELEGFRERLLGPTTVLRGAAMLAAGLITFPTHGLLSEVDLGRLEGWVASPA